MSSTCTYSTCTKQLLFEVQFKISSIPNGHPQVPLFFTVHDFFYSWKMYFLSQIVEMFMSFVHVIKEYFWSLHSSCPSALHILVHKLHKNWNPNQMHLIWIVKKFCLQIFSNWKWSHLINITRPTSGRPKAMNWFV